MPETQIGFFTDNGASYFLSRIRGGLEVGLYAALTGLRVKGKDLLTYGLATHFVTEESMEKLA